MRVIISLCLAAVLFSAADVLAQKKKKGQSVAGFYKYEVECEGTEMDGTQMVRAFGTGKNRQDAIEQAKKNAVYAVIFKGVRLGREGCSVKPLVFGANAEEENQDYFYEFFQDGGKFLEFVSVDDSPARSKIKEKSGEGKEKLFGLIVSINIPKLRKELINKGIIKKNIE